MSKKLIEELSSNGMVVVFDVDGVLAPYEWGLRKHCMSDKEWTSILESGVDMYSHVKPIKCMQDFIKRKRIEDVYVCSKSEKAEYESKKNFCIREYGIPENHIKLVEHKSDKVLFLDELAKQLDVIPSEIAIVEDTVETLNKIANSRDYYTVHVSSFFEEDDHNEIINKQEEIFKKSIKIYGKDAQCRQAMEECAELIQAINKCLRYPDDGFKVSNLIEEIADVKIMLFQLQEIFEINNSTIDYFINFKADRENKRIAKLTNNS